MTQPETCSEISVDLREPLHGTGGKTISHWILLEDRSSWGRDAFETASSRVVQQTESWARAIPGSKCLGIRRKGRTDGPLTMFSVNIADGTIWQWQADTMEALVSIDADALVSGRGASPGPATLFLVCTHGKRDQCCALRGAPVFLALLAQLGEERTWQTTHVGGHRFAANVLAFPSGILYGRVRSQDAQALVESERERRVFALEHLRGQSHLPRPVQYADAWLRARLQELQLDALQVVSQSNVENVWTVGLEHQGDWHEVVVQVDSKASKPRSVSCGEAPKRVDEYEVLEHRQGRRATGGVT